MFVSDGENCVGGAGNLDLHISCFFFLQLLITSPSYLVLGKSDISSNLLARGLPISPSRKSVCSPSTPIVPTFSSLLTKVWLHISLQCMFFAPQPDPWKIYYYSKKSYQQPILWKSHPTPRQITQKVFRKTVGTHACEFRISNLGTA